MPESQYVAKWSQPGPYIAVTDPELGSPVVENGRCVADRRSSDLSDLFNTGGRRVRGRCRSVRVRILVPGGLRRTE